MHRFGFLILLLVTVAVSIAAVLSVGERHEDTVDRRKEGLHVFPALRDVIDDVVIVEITRADARFVLERNDERWLNHGLGGYPARPRMVASLIAGLANLRYLEPRTAQATLYPKLAVEEPAPGAKSTRLRLATTANARLADIIVGKARTGPAPGAGDGVYVRLPGDARAWLARGRLDVHHDAPEWSDRQLIDVPASEIEVLSIEHRNGEAIELGRQQPLGQDLVLLGLPADMEIEHHYQIDYLAGIFSSLAFDDARPEHQPPGDGADSNGPRKDEAPSARVQAITSGGLTLIMDAFISGDDGAVWARFEANLTPRARPAQAAVDAARRIRNATTGWHLRMPSSVAKRLELRLSDIVRDRKARQ